MKEVFENFSKKYLGLEGTISGKSFFFRIIIVNIVVLIIYEYIWFIDSIEVFDAIATTKKGYNGALFSFIAALIGEFPTVIQIMITFSLFTKRIRAFTHKIFAPGLIQLWIIAWFLQGFFLILSPFFSFMDNAENYQDGYLFLYLMFSELLKWLFFLFLCFKNSPIIDYKQHKG